MDVNHSSEKETGLNLLNTHSVRFLFLIGFPLRAGRLAGRQVGGSAELTRRRSCCRSSPRAPVTPGPQRAGPPAPDAGSGRTGSCPPDWWPWARWTRSAGPYLRHRASWEMKSFKTNSALTMGQHSIKKISQTTGSAWTGYTSWDTQQHHILSEYALSRLTPTYFHRMEIPILTYPGLEINSGQ